MTKETQIAKLLQQGLNKALKIENYSESNTEIRFIWGGELNYVNLKNIALVLGTQDIDIQCDDDQFFIITARIAARPETNEPEYTLVSMDENGFTINS